jgi:LmbE family N-acetylglucosaminyl deacetylase
VGDVIRSLSPDGVITHPHEGGHPDHDATALAVRPGCRPRGAGGEPAAAAGGMWGYRMGPDGIEPYRSSPHWTRSNAR